MEYAPNGSLGQALTRRPKSFWNPTGISIIICGIVLVMRYIHSQSLVHCDLKTENVLLNEEGHSLISDFGTCFDEQGEVTPDVPTGTQYYAAPERFSEGDPTNKADVFSFGLILCEILTGRRVFNADFSKSEVMEAITKGRMPAIPDRVLSWMKALIMKCWSLNPTDRPSFDDILTEFAKRNFAIVPDADCETVRKYVRGVQDWEDMRDHAERKSASPSTRNR
jgi:serine/threonine protein kinase